MTGSPGGTGPSPYADLERRVRALEEGLSRAAQSGTPPEVLPGVPPDAGDDTWWLLDRLSGNKGPAFSAPGVAGSVAYGGITATTGGGRLMWQAEHPLPDVLAADVRPAAAVLAALGHPVRLEILRRLLLGDHTLAELQRVPGIGTTGQLHHHLRELRAVGLVVHRRNYYAAAPDRVVPWLVAVAAALGPHALAGTSTPPPPAEE